MIRSESAYISPILKKRSREIEIIDDKIKELAKDMMDTMHKWDGLGLAAPQVGILKRIIVIDLYEKDTQFILINPIIVKQKGEQIVEEGCLSFPNKFGKVLRPKEVIVEALDIEGKKIDFLPIFVRKFMRAMMNSKADLGIIYKDIDDKLYLKFLECKYLSPSNNCLKYFLANSGGNFSFFDQYSSSFLFKSDSQNSNTKTNFLDVLITSNK